MLLLMIRLHQTRHARWLHLSTTLKTRLNVIYKVYYTIQRSLEPSDRACSFQNVAISVAMAFLWRLVGVCETLRYC